MTAALAYAATVFAAGFVMGTLRVLALEPALGAVPAVLLELPVMLAVSLLAARWAIRRHDVPAKAGARATMGALAFALLMAAEVALGTLGFGRTLADIGRGFLAPQGLIGLAGQVGFGLMPLILLAWPGRLR